MEPTRKRTVQKTFFEVKAPLISAKISLYGASAEEFEGRIVRLDLTRSLRGKNLEVLMRVKHNEGILSAEPISTQVFGSYIRRMMRKGADYVEDSFTAQCKDTILLVKPFLITRNKVSRAVQKALRDTAKDHLMAYMTPRTALELFTDIMTNKI
ncbi:hypothetical protein HYZ97_01640 [Candidatus Pacearchaeota archaeon]|nr:hypothetical protein [Candidatus Pacearchaeota archaeon]